MSHGHGDHMIEQERYEGFFSKIFKYYLKKDQSSIIGEENTDNINETTNLNKQTRRHRASRSIFREDL